MGFLPDGTDRLPDPRRPQDRGQNETQGRPVLVASANAPGGPFLEKVRLSSRLRARKESPSRPANRRAAMSRLRWYSRRLLPCQLRPASPTVRHLLAKSPISLSNDVHYFRPTEVDSVRDLLDLKRGSLEERDDTFFDSTRPIVKGRDRKTPALKPEADCRVDGDRTAGQPFCNNRVSVEVVPPQSFNFVGDPLIARRSGRIDWPRLARGATLPASYYGDSHPHLEVG